MRIVKIKGKKMRGIRVAADLREAKLSVKKDPKNRAYRKVDGGYQVYERI